MLCSTASSACPLRLDAGRDYRMRREQTQCRRCLTMRSEYAVSMEVFERTVRAALRILAVASVEDVLSLLTTEALRNEMAIDRQAPPPSSRTIAQAFSARGSDGRFNRGRLVEAMLERTIEDVSAVARTHAEGYLQAADTVRRGGGPEAVAAAISRDFREYQPGGSDAITERERAFHVCLAMCDDEPTLARQLRHFLSEHAAAYAEATATFGKVFKRRLATGVSPEHLHIAINAYLRGIQSLYLRSGAEINSDAISETVIRIYWAHTTPISGPERSPTAELWAGLAGHAVRSRWSASSR